MTHGTLNNFDNTVMFFKNHQKIKFVARIFKIQISNINFKHIFDKIK